MKELVKQVALNPNSFAYEGELRLIADPQTGIRKFVPRSFVNREMIPQFALEHKMIPDLYVRVCPMIALINSDNQSQFKLIQQFIDIKNGHDIVGFDIFAEEWIRDLPYIARFNIHGMCHRVRDFKIFLHNEEIMVIFDEP